MHDQRRDLLRRAFRGFNRWAAVPVLRAGLGPWIATPVGGWLLLLRVRGRRSGVLRDVPLSYLVADGAAWVMAGFGGQCDWLRNVATNPQVEVVLPGRTVACVAERVHDAGMRRRIVPQLVRATGVAGFMTGCDPYRATAEQLLAVTEGLPLVRLRPLGEPLVAGPDDPGGWGWVWRQSIALALVAWLVHALRRRGARAVSAA